MGFVLTETIDGRFVPWESSLDWESYIDLYCLALMRRGHTCIKYVPSIEAKAVKSYRHAFGHVVKRVPVHHPLMNPGWLSRRRTGRTGLSTTAHQLQGMGFAAYLLKEVRADLIDVLHYSSYYSSFFIPSFLMRQSSKVMAQYSGGSLPSNKFNRLFWRVLLAPGFFFSSAVLIGDYRSERASLRAQAGAPSNKIRDFDSPIVDTAVFWRRPRVEAIRRTGFDPDAINVLSVTFIPRRSTELLAKNPFALVSLIAEAARLGEKRLTLHFAGFGPGTDELRAHARAVGVDQQVKMLGRVKHDLLPAFYSASDLVFVPYPFEKLNEGSVTYEAFACGSPVAGWKRSAEVPVEQKGGFLVDMDPASGARELMSRVRDRAYMKVKGEEALEIGREVSLEVAGAKLDSIYSRAVRSTGHEYVNRGLGELGSRSLVRLAQRQG